MGRYKAVVTGAMGFIGINIALSLLKRDFELLCVDRKNISVQGFPLENDRCRLIIKDLDKALLEIENFLSDVPVESRFIFHMAGSADSNACERNPDLAYSQNVAMTTLLLESVERIGGGVFVFPSTAEVYASSNMTETIDENFETDTNSVYGKSKLAAEAELSAFAQNCKISAVTARLSNVFGWNSSPNTVIGRLLGQVMDGIALEVSNATPIRDFIYIDDVAEGLIRLAMSARKRRNTIVNLSTGTGTSIGQVQEILSDLSGLAVATENLLGGESLCTSKRVLSNEKLYALTGWRPGVSVKAGLKQSIEQMRENAS